MSSKNKHERRARPAQCKTLSGKNTWNLDSPLVQWSRHDTFTLREAVESVAIFGEVGAGKTSGRAKKVDI
jgi:hypothetical protein